MDALQTHRILIAHEAAGVIVVLLAIAALFNGRARRAVVYALAVQILIGAVAWHGGAPPPPALHWILALASGGVYAMANAAERRGRPAGTVRALTIAGALILALIFSIGMNAMGK